MTELLPCSLCGEKLNLYIYDDTQSKFSGGLPNWIGGASCEGCGVGFEVGSFGGGINVEIIEKITIEVLNRRPSC